MQFEEGSDELTAWVKKQKHRLHRGKTAKAILSLNGLQIAQRHEKRLSEIFGYLQKLMSMMNYDELRAEDLDVSTGVVEGAVRHVIAKHFDSGGMRWIRERAEALLQLRCIEINGEWDEFASFVRSRALAEEPHEVERRLLRGVPAELPTLRLAT